METGRPPEKPPHILAPRRSRVLRGACRSRERPPREATGAFLGAGEDHASAVEATESKPSLLDLVQRWLERIAAVLKAYSPPAPAYSPPAPAYSPALQLHPTAPPYCPALQPPPTAQA